MAFKHTACFVITVMLVCNAVLYPSIFSTIFKQWFGGSDDKEERREVEPEPGKTLFIPFFWLVFLLKILDSAVARRDLRYLPRLL